MTTVNIDLHEKRTIYLTTAMVGTIIFPNIKDND